ncbi:MAG TPA: SRPBCC domain-containing protein [Solirubrobacteraceae bacterium]|jgi:uncharacterized protein YndB with AHSA1/START domain|nr:SRPBCC domain-containing protein [Solirubrobacteraceae bacterium]
MPGTSRETSAIEHEVRVAARPETVFAHFTDPVRMVRWMGTDATLDPRPGGVCRIDVNGAAMLGEFVEVDPYRRIVFTWGWEQELFSVTAQSTVVEVSFTPDGENTIVHLIHRRMPGAAAAAFHRAGWEHYLQRLAVVAGGADPGPDPWRDPEIALAKVHDALAPSAD